MSFCGLQWLSVVVGGGVEKDLGNVTQLGVFVREQWWLKEGREL